MSSEIRPASAGAASRCGGGTTSMRRVSHRSVPSDMRTSVRIVLDREALEAMLAEGLSLEAIGRCVEGHPSTVSYWLKKHGLDAAHRLRHLNRGGIPREALLTLVAADLTVREIATELDRSATTVTYWLRAYGLSTTTAARRKRVAKLNGAREPGVCTEHGETTFVIAASGRKVCLKCRAAAVTKRRQVVKRM